MPIKPENRKRYPKNWKQISEDIRFNRAQNKCEVCGVSNHAVGYRKLKQFVPLDRANNFDYYAGQGLDAVTKEMLTFKKARTIAEIANDYYNLGYKCIVIVLTVAHLDHNPENNDYSNLKAMCQKCHNSYDAPHRRQTFKKSKLIGQLKLEL
jgi:5-methylcytosine-specific restriction endonuclease McrA